MQNLWESNSNLPTDELYDALKSGQMSEDELTRLCREYLEIALGVRRPTEEEANASGKVLVSMLLRGDPIQPEDRLKVAKYPPNLSDVLLRRTLATLEYAVFKILSEHDNVVDGPYLPMLRAEIWKSVEDFEENRPLVILRQAAFFETYCRMKLGRSKKTEWRHLNLDDISVLTPGDIQDLDKLRDCRGDYAHDWRVYLGYQANKEEIRDECARGLELLSKLHRRELIKLYTLVCSAPISCRYPCEWQDRRAGEFNGRARVSIHISCDRCDHVFSPLQDGFKKCPECDASHEFLSRYS